MLPYDDREDRGVNRALGALHFLHVAAEDVSHHLGAFGLDKHEQLADDAVDGTGAHLAAALNGQEYRIQVPDKPVV